MEKKQKSKSWSIASMVCGILGIVLWPAPYFGLPLSILGIVFRCKNKESAMSTAGMVMGIIGIVINAVMLLILALATTLLSMLP